MNGKSRFSLLALISIDPQLVTGCTMVKHKYIINNVFHPNYLNMYFLFCFRYLRIFYSNSSIRSFCETKVGHRAAECSALFSPYRFFFILSSAMRTRSLALKAPWSVGASALRLARSFAMQAHCLDLRSFICAALLLGGPELDRGIKLIL